MQSVLAGNIEMAVSNSAQPTLRMIKFYSLAKTARDVRVEF
jgi:hypothetical protein